MGIVCEYTGIGAHTTWHGSPDCCSRGCGNKDDFNIMIPRSKRADVSTYGDAIREEAKLKISRRNYLPQLVSLNVVASFVGACRHPNLVPAVPSLLISKDESVMSLYNTNSDELFISRNVGIATKLGCMS